MYKYYKAYKSRGLNRVGRHSSLSENESRLLMTVNRPLPSVTSTNGDFDFLMLMMGCSVSVEDSDAKLSDDEWKLSFWERLAKLLLTKCSDDVLFTRVPWRKAGVAGDSGPSIINISFMIICNKNGNGSKSIPRHTTKKRVEKRNRCDKLPYSSPKYSAAPHRTSLLSSRSGKSWWR